MLLLYKIHYSVRKHVSQIDRFPTTCLVKGLIFYYTSRQVLVKFKYFALVTIFLDPTTKEFKFVKNTTDQEGFFQQVGDGIISVVCEREEITAGNNNSDSVTVDSAAPSSSSSQPTSGEFAIKKNIHS